MGSVTIYVYLALRSLYQAPILLIIREIIPKKERKNPRYIIFPPEVEIINPNIIIAQEIILAIFQLLFINTGSTFIGIEIILPQPGHVGALSEISLLHSGHLIKAICL